MSTFQPTELDSERTNREHLKSDHPEKMPMSALPTAVPVTESEHLDIACDQAIAACGGNLRSTIRALLIANEYLEFRNHELAMHVSIGFVRGQIPANNKLEDSLHRELGEGNSCQR